MIVISVTELLLRPSNGHNNNNGQSQEKLHFK